MAPARSCLGDRGPQPTQRIRVSASELPGRFRVVSPTNLDTVNGPLQQFEHRLRWFSAELRHVAWQQTKMRSRRDRGVKYSVTRLRRSEVKLPSRGDAGAWKHK